MAWSFMVTDRAGNPVGELDDAHNRVVRRPLNRVPTFTFSVRRDHQFAALFRSSDQVLIKGYDDAIGNRVLRFHGPVIGYQKQADDSGGSLAVNAAGVGWRLGLRIVEQSKSATGYNPASTDRGMIAKAIIDALNTSPVPSGVGATVADTGIRAATGNITATVASTPGPWYYKNALEAISELSAALDGYDWRIDPTEATVDATGLQLGSFVAGPAFGATRPDTVYEFGDGKRNVVSFQEVGDAGKLLNRAFSLPPGFPQNATQVAQSWNDAAAITSRGVLYEDVISSNLVDDALRLKLIQNNVAVRKVPKTVITFNPPRSPDGKAMGVAGLLPGAIPVYGVDVAEGDVVTFRAVEYGVETINALFRVYAIDINIDDEGNVLAAPTLISQDG